MISIKTKKEIDVLRDGGKILSSVLDEVIKSVKVGVNIRDLDLLAERLILGNNGVPSFKNYKSHKDDIPFPSTMCISINNEVVHGAGNRDIVLSSGDIVDFDIGMRYPAKNGFYTDMSKTVFVESVDKEVERLLSVTKKSLELGIEQVKPGNKIADIARAIQSYVESNNFSVVRKLTGHGVGFGVHEDPMIPNFVEDRFGEIKLKEGMVLAIEPMVNMGDYDIKTADDGWTVVTADGSLSAHFEHTVVVAKDGFEVLTK